MQILGISSSNPFSQKTFADSLQLPYPLLSDFPDLTVIRSYGGLNRQWDMTTANRFFFLIDQEGIVRGKWPGKTFGFFASEPILKAVHELTKKR